MYLNLRAPSAPDIQTKPVSSQFFLFLLVFLLAPVTVL